MNYGPPQRFKGIDKTTGDLTALFLLTSSVQCDESLDNSAFYQSTGHHDANGKEIFFGDVLLNIEPRMGVHPGIFVTVVFVDGQIFMRCDGQALDMSDPPSKGNYRIEKCDSFAVIGNRHHSPEQLQAAAEKVRAEL